MSRVAVVTGAAGGIGLGCAEQLVADGCAVALLDRNGPGAQEAAAKLQAAGAKTIGLEVDVADRASVDASYDRIRAELGPIEIVVTSAGIEAFEKVLDVTQESWDRIIAVNLTGTFGCIQSALPDMFAAKWGRIVTIASSSAQSGAPRMTHYAASKGGVISLTKALAVELARKGITANAISPTVVDTPMAQEATERGDFPGVDVVAPMIPAGRAGTPADIAAACSYLASEAASYVTGQVVCVSGGMYI